jgi:6-pyruvoyltetrahydropterin/6-carboxytetrahydropterin synthase
MRGLGAHYELHIRCTGAAAAAMGYLIDIKEVDRAARSAVIPLIQEAAHTRPLTDPAQLLPDLCRALIAALPSAASLRWNLSPYYSVEMTTREATAASATALLRQKFDFSASHRLHNPALSDEENRRAFGKCNHPSGHGHNYQLEVCVAVPAGPGAPDGFSLDALERLTDRVIIQRFDHKYLNQDTEEFRTGSGVNPTVENIAKVCYDLLAPAIVREGNTAALRSVTVWETDRTSCTYPA